MSILEIDLIKKQKYHSQTSCGDTKKAKETLATNAPPLFLLQKPAKAILAAKYIVYACHVMSDGLGDALHFADLVNLHYKTDKFNKFSPLYIMTCPELYLKQIVELLKARGIQTTADNFHLIPYKEKITLHHRLAFYEYCKANTVLQKQLKLAEGMFNISTHEMNIHVTKIEMKDAAYYSAVKIYPRIGVQLRSAFKSIDQMIPCFTIGELGTTTVPAEIIRANPEYYFSLGSADDEFGYFFEDGSDIQLADFLKECADNTFLQRLFDTNKDNVPGIDLEKFFKQNLILPAYLQGGVDLFLSLLSVVVNAPIGNKYKDIIIFANQEKDNIFDMLEKHITDFPCTVKSVTVFKNADASPETGRKSILNPKFNLEKETEKEGVHIKIFIGWLPTKLRAILWKFATLFCGCSGDKTLEEALGFGHIPLMHVKNYKAKFWEIFIARAANIVQKKLKAGEENYVTPYLTNLLEISKNHFSIQVDSKFDPRQVPGYQADLQVAIINCSKALTPQFIEQWQMVLQELRINFNFKDKFPKIADQMLQYGVSCYPTGRISTGSSL